VTGRDVVLAMQHVSKRFRRGELHDSLRDLIPALARRAAGRGKRERELRRGEFWALRDVSFEVRRGEAFGVIGSNGAGKSTILKLLSGILAPTEGQVLVNGTLSALIEVGAGFHPDLTGRENVFLNGTIVGMTRAEIARKFDEIVEFSGLGEFIDTPVKRYSSGMYARLGFSVAAHVEPDLLIVDEVLSVGDNLFQKKCAEKMKAVISSGATVIFVSHNLRAVAELCQRSMLLERGGVLQIGPTEDVLMSYLDRGIRSDSPDVDDEIHIPTVRVRREDRDGVHFNSGDTVLVDVEVKARRASDGLGVVLVLRDEDGYEVFNTTTARLGHGTFALEPGVDFRCTFELVLHLAQGRYHLETFVYRHTDQRAFDRRPRATLLMRCDNDVHGVANLYPRVVSMTGVPEPLAPARTAPGSARGRGAP
jgi:ABC-type polysaccharide/polyol phosphate transport system ATPase subunit